MHESHLKDLNEKQLEAVEHKEGPLLIIAGAGAGKTKTITHRILHLIHSGVSPSSILAITFTNKAAKEMSDRVEKLISSETRQESGEKPFVSTFHSLGVFILRNAHLKLGLPKHFNIYDRDDSKKAVREAMKMCDVDTKTFDPGKVLSVIGREKGNVVTAEKYVENNPSGYTQETIGKIWQEYERILKREKALDFDDLLLKSVLLLKSDPELLSHYQKKWSYIHIDEYQDTNEVQYQITKLLSDKHKNIAVIGDIDQTIYSWRGASIKNILHFEKDYPEAKVVLLEENYRSTQTILTVANRIIEKNKFRREKNLFTRLGEGDKISVYEGYDENDEAGFVAAKAKELIEEHKVSPKEISVLYRANFQGRALEEAFLSNDTPYQVLGIRFFERKEVKDIISYLRASLSPDSLTDLKRVINSPVRGIGKTTVLKIMSGQRETLPNATKEKVDSFYLLLENIKKVSETEKLSDTIKYIIKKSGFEELLKGKSEEEMERLQNIQELATYATRYDTLSPESAIEKFLTDVSLSSDQDELMKDRDAVRLMTVHASKGLEFSYVFITGLEDGLFPHQRFDEGGGDDAASEEER